LTDQTLSEAVERTITTSSREIKTKYKDDGSESKTGWKPNKN